MKRSASRAQEPSPKWRGRIPAARYGLQDFLALDLPPERFDGIFANASIFHVPVRELPRVLGELRAALKPRGVLFSSIPHGDDSTLLRDDGRYSVFHAPETWRRHMRDAGFEELHAFLPAGRKAARAAAVVRERVAEIA